MKAVLFDMDGVLVESYEAWFHLLAGACRDLGYPPLSRDLFDSSWDNLRDRPENYGVQFVLTLPLWDSGMNRAQVASARMSLEQSEMSAEHLQSQVRQQIRATIDRLEEARNRLDALKKSEELAQRNYEISLSRFDSGDITGQELANDRDRLTGARQAYLSAYIQYQLAVADLKRQTLYDFEQDLSLVGGVR